MESKVLQVLSINIDAAAFVGAWVRHLCGRPPESLNGEWRLRSCEPRSGGTDVYEETVVTNTVWERQRSFGGDLWGYLPITPHPEMCPSR